MATKITPEELWREKRYRLIRELRYQEIPEFVISYLFRGNQEIRFFWLSVLLFLIIAIQPTTLFFSSGPDLLHGIWYGVLGFILFPLLLIPVHEGIHVLFFLLSGVRNIRIGADLKNLFFYVTADHDPVNRKTFTRIALAPFFVINTLLWGAAWMFPDGISWSLYITLFVHTTMCAGDFALLSFYRDYGDREIITYDDVDFKTSYFFIIEEPEQKTKKEDR
jgi:hypothetical protein